MSFAIVEVFTYETIKKQNNWDNILSAPLTLRVAEFYLTTFYANSAYTLCYLNFKHILMASTRQILCILKQCKSNLYANCKKLSKTVVAEKHATLLETQLNNKG